eukprot:403339495
MKTDQRKLTYDIQCEGVSPDNHSQQQQNQTQDKSMINDGSFIQSSSNKCLLGVDLNSQFANNLSQAERTQCSLDNQTYMSPNLGGCTNDFDNKTSSQQNRNMLFTPTLSPQLQNQNNEVDKIQEMILQATKKRPPVALQKHHSSYDVDIQSRLFENLAGTGGVGNIPQFYKVIVIGDCNVGKTSIIRRFTQNIFSFERVPTTKIQEITSYLFPVRINHSSSCIKINSPTNLITPTNKQIASPSLFKTQSQNTELDTFADSSVKNKYINQISSIKRSVRQSPATYQYDSLNSISLLDQKQQGLSTYKIIGLDIWDTLGQERHSSLVSTYYKNASVIMIVYDVTNMESFLNVKSWLIELEDHFLPVNQIHNFQQQNQIEESYILVGNKADLESQRQVTKERGRELAESFGLAFIEVSACSGKNIKQCFQILSQNILQKQEQIQLDKLNQKDNLRLSRKEEISRNSIKLMDSSTNQKQRGDKKKDNNLFDQEEIDISFSFKLDSLLMGNLEDNLVCEGGESDADQFHNYSQCSSFIEECRSSLQSNSKQQMKFSQRSSLYEKMKRQQNDKINFKKRKNRCC